MRLRELFVRPQRSRVLSCEYPSAAVILDGRRSNHLPWFVVNDLLDVNSFEGTAAHLKVFARIGAYRVIETAKRTYWMQECCVRLIACSAGFDFRLLLSAMGAAHAMKMGVKTFIAGFAFRCTLVDQFAARARFAAFPRFPLRSTFIVIACEHAAWCSHHGV